MNYLHSLFLCFLVGPSVLLAQADSTKKKFKPYALIDAAPVAVNKDDFKPQINLTIQALDAITNLPVDAKIDYYTFGDSALASKNGQIVSWAAQGNEKIVIVANASGYIWQTQIFNPAHAGSDTSYILKFKRMKKGDEITLHKFDFNLQDNKFESLCYPDLLGLQEFSKLNSTVQIQISGYPKGKEKVFSQLLKNSNKKRVRFKNCRNQKQKNSETVTIKILRL